MTDRREIGPHEQVVLSQAGEGGWWQQSKSWEALLVQMGKLRSGMSEPGPESLRHGLVRASFLLLD